MPGLLFDHKQAANRITARSGRQSQVLLPQLTDDSLLLQFLPSQLQSVDHIFWHAVV